MMHTYYSPVFIECLLLCPESRKETVEEGEFSILYEYKFPKNWPLLLWLYQRASLSFLCQ